MMKVKINLVSGAIAEKNVLTAFNNGVGTYVALDNESIGSMGLPIILVSKIVDNKVTKIVDENEWNTVKEGLRQAMAGNQMNYVNVSPEMSGEDIYYTQLTLPIASFDAIKNNYKPVQENGMNGSNINVVPVANNNVVNPTVAPMPNVAMPDNNMMQSTSVMPNPVSSVEMPSVAPTPVPTPAPMPSIMPQVENIPTPEPIVQPMPQPMVEQQIQSVPTPSPVPSVEPQPVVEQPVTQLEMPTPVPEVMPVQNIETVPNTSNVVPNIPNIPSIADLTADKEAFLKACENIFDALVAKFNKGS